MYTTRSKYDGLHLRPPITGSEKQYQESKITPSAPMGPQGQSPGIGKYLSTSHCVCTAKKTRTHDPPLPNLLPHIPDTSSRLIHQHLPHLSPGSKANASPNPPRRPTHTYPTINPSVYSPTRSADADRLLRLSSGAVLPDRCLIPQVLPYGGCDFRSDRAKLIRLKFSAV